MVRNNYKIIKLGDIYTQKYKSLFYLCGQKTYKEAKLLNICSMVDQFMVSVKYVWHGVVWSQKDMFWILSMLGFWGEHCRMQIYLDVFDKMKKASTASFCGAFQLSPKSLILCQMIAHHYIHQIGQWIKWSAEYSVFWPWLWIITRFDLECINRNRYWKNVYRIETMIKRKENMYIYIYIYIYIYMGKILFSLTLHDMSCTALVYQWHSGYNIVVKKFKLQLCYYIHFWTNILRKGINSLMPLTMGSIIPLMSFYKDSFE